jgi:hypothetical protein
MDWADHAVAGHIREALLADAKNTGSPVSVGSIDRIWCPAKMTYQIDEPTQRFVPDERRYFSYRRRSVDGVCNVCQRRKRLTFDHVPPAGCNNREDVEVSPMHSVLAGVTQETKPTIIQSGLKYRTICKKCNECLGSHYDPALIGLTKFISTALASTLTLPRYVKVRTRPAAILRSILGHLVAAKIDTHSSLFDEEVRPCILDETISVPEKYHLHYWIYPHWTTVVVRDTLSFDTQLNSPNRHIFFQMLKFFPLGFLVLDRSDITSPPKFGNFNDVSPTQFHDISIDLNEVREAQFPEWPGDSRATFYGRAGGAAAVARRRRKRQLR